MRRLLPALPLRLSTLRLWALPLVVGMGMSGATAHAQKEAPVLHEYIAPDVDEDVALSSTAPGGELPAAVRTPSGTISPPDLRTTPDPDRVYHQQSATDARFRPDRDTRRPDVERYDDPFTPALTPFKRMYAYDAVRDDYTLYVREPEPARVEVTTSPDPGADRFFGDMSVALQAGALVRIPSVGPDVALLEVVTRPDTPVEIFRDGADNWFVRSETSARVRLVTDLAIARESFASEFSDVSWSALPPVPAQPAAHRASFDKVRREIGINRTMRPREVVSEMISYFRSFTPSDEPPGGTGDIYLDLAMSKKGVCRHRAFAFLVTSLHMGIPARMVHNEAHAWVEVRDDRHWHRIDLGGAALDLDGDPNLERPPHVPPPDQFPWPTGRDSGADLAHRNRSEALEDQPTPGGGAGEPGGGAYADPAAPGTSSDSAPNDLPPTDLSVDEIDRDIFRGLPVKIRGKATSKGEPCPRLRVDVLLAVEGETLERRLGSLSTDAAGNYSGEVVVPPDVPIGDHELVVVTPGSAVCGFGEAR